MRKYTLLLLVFIIVSNVVHAQKKLFPYLGGTKWGFANSKGVVVIAPKFDWVDFFRNGRAEVRYKDNSCIIDEKGQYIIPPWRHWNRNIYSNLVGAQFNAQGKNGKYGIIDGNGKELIPCVYEKTDGNKHPSLWTGYFAWDYRFHTYAAKAMKNGKVGIIDTLNRTLIPFMYDGFLGGFESDMPPRYYMVRVKEKYGLINTQNKMVIPAIYENIRFDQLKWRVLWLQTKHRAMIADTFGNIMVDNADYNINFPYDTLIVINNKNGYGIMSIHNQLLIPCLYSNIYIKGDSVMEIGDSTAPHNRSRDFARLMNRHTWQPASPWFPESLVFPRYIAPSPEPPARYGMPFYFNSKSQNFYKKDSFTWACINAKWSDININYYVEGKIEGADSFDYTAVLDSKGNYILQPLKTNKRIGLLNARDSLFSVDPQNKDSNYSVVNKDLKVLMKAKHRLVSAFYYESKLYAIECRDTIIESHSYNHPSTQATFYKLIGDDGTIVKGFEKYNLLWNSDQYGYGQTANKYQKTEEGQFTPPYSGYFFVRDKTNNTSGIINIDNRISIPKVSFQYDDVKPVGHGFFIVTKHTQQENDLRSMDLQMPHSDDEYLSLPLKEQPYLVNAQNHILLDSMSVEDVINQAEKDEEPLFEVFLTRPYTDERVEDIYFYMDITGRGYYGNLPKSKKKRRSDNYDRSIY